MRFTFARLVMAVLTSLAAAASTPARADSFATCDGPIDSRGNSTAPSPGVFALSGAVQEGEQARQVAQTFKVPVGSADLPWLPGSVTVLARRTAAISPPEGTDANLYVELVHLAAGSNPPIPASSGGTCDNDTFADVIARGSYDTTSIPYGTTTSIRLVFHYDLHAPAFSALQGGETYALIFHVANANPVGFALSGSSNGTNDYSNGRAATRRMSWTSGDCVVNTEWVNTFAPDVDFCLTVNDGIVIQADGGTTGEDAGEQPNEDAGASDAGEQPSADAGPSDAGDAADANAGMDAGVSGDAGTFEDGGLPNEFGDVPVGGCDCASGDFTVFALLGLAMLFTRRRSSP